MRSVALVHDWLTGMRGGEKVLEALVEIFPSAEIFTLFHFEGSVSDPLEARPIHTTFLQRLPGLRERYRNFLPIFPNAIESLDLSGFDLVISSSHCVAKGVLVSPSAFHLCYCHTPMRYAWDQEAEYFPDRRGPIALLRALALARLRVWDVASAARVDAFVANSSFVAERIRRYYDRPADVVHPPVDVDFFQPDPSPSRAKDGDRYFLSVAALAPYKRHRVAIEACREAGVQLRIVGSGPDREALERAASGSDVRFLGRVEGERLLDLYRGAEAFLQPAVEDFGIAAVEALACGTPVIACGRGGVVDIVEDERHGLLYDPDGGSAALARAIDKCHRLRFNPLHLRRRSETFSRQSFETALWRTIGRLAPTVDGASAGSAGKGESAVLPGGNSS